MIPLPASLGAALVCVLAWLIFANTPQKWLALVYLWGSVAGLAAAYHHWHRYHVDANDIQHQANYDGKPIRLPDSGSPPNELRVETIRQVAKSDREVVSQEKGIRQRRDIP